MERMLSDGTYSRYQQDKKSGIVPPPHAIIHPLAMMITTINTVITLKSTLNTRNKEKKKKDRPSCNDWNEEVCRSCRWGNI